MTDTDSNAVTLITDAIGGIPEPVQTSFIKALSRLVGGVMALPGAKLKQIAQGIEDTTVAKSAYSAALTRAAVDSINEHPLVVQAASEALLSDSVRKIRNRIEVAQKSAEHLASQTYVSENEQQSAPPDDDWMNHFMRLAEDASSERLQDLFGRILAGQLTRKGAFSLSTLRTVSELDQQIADDFNYAWSKCIGDTIDYSPEWTRGRSYDIWARLAEAGLMAPSESVRFLPPFKPLVHDLGLWSPLQAPDIYTTFFYRQPCSTQWTNIPFTKVGREIGSLLPAPDYRKNMLEVIAKIPKEHIALIQLNQTGKPVENVWSE